MNAAWAVALGAAAGADRTAFGQTLLSHPAVAAALAGWAVGAPREGAWLGVALTLLSTPHVPVGRERLRDWCSAAIAACCAAGPEREPWVWGAALALSLLVARGGGLLIAALRRLNARLVDALGAPVSPAAPSMSKLERVHLACGAMELVRGGLVALVAAGAIAAALAWLEPLLAGPERRALSAFWTLAPLVGLPLALRLRSGGVPHRWLWPGVAVGLAAAWIRGGQP